MSTKPKKKATDKTANEKSTGEKKSSKKASTELKPLQSELKSEPIEKSKNAGGIAAELVTGHHLTHFDETAGVAIASWEAQPHKDIGNIVTLLTDAYKYRYEKLRSLLTGKLLPKREHLLLLRRQLQNCSVEVDAKRRGIERETLTDTEQILERLRAVESMRQSSIKHQILQVEEELQSIERIVKRVEQANISEQEQLHTTGVLLLTSAHPGAIPTETIRPPRTVAMVELIHEYGPLCESINRASIKPITVQAEFPVDDFPRETTERLEVLARCDKYMHAVSIKDHMLWIALQEKDKAEEALKDERQLCQEYADEVANWAEASQQWSQKNLALKAENEILQGKVQTLMNILRQNNIYYEEVSS